MASQKANCMKCKHYYNTWEPACPKGCRVYGFKSLTTPSMVVKRETGSECQAFEERAIHKQRRKNDLNDKSNW